MDIKEMGGLLSARRSPPPLAGNLPPACGPEDRQPQPRREENA